MCNALLHICTGTDQCPANSCKGPCTKARGPAPSSAGPSSSSSEYVVTSACPENQGLSTANGIETNPDLWHALVEPEAILRCFQAYLAAQELSVSRAEFEANLADKMLDSAPTKTWCRCSPPASDSTTRSPRA